jgi:serine/threonine protein phosphatase PrpC
MNPEPKPEEAVTFSSTPASPLELASSGEDLDEAKPMEGELHLEAEEATGAEAEPQASKAEGEVAVAALEEVTPQPEPPQNLHLALSFLPPPDAPFQSSLTLGLVCATDGAQIRYALGVSDVGEEDQIFDPKDKILLTQSTLVTARAFKDGKVGPLLTGNFEIKKPLWQELEPVDQSDATPHKIGENGSTADGWKISAGSVRGKLHAHRALWREDSFGFSTAQSGSTLWQIVAVSDGAGSAPLSRVGSRIACDTAVGDLQTSLAELPEFSPDKEALAERDLPALRDSLNRAATRALEAIRAEAESRSKSVSAFAATLLILVRREWNGAQLCASIQVGDGAIGLWDESGMTLLGVADHGQHSSETRFLTTNGIEAELASRVKFSVKTGLYAFALMSDGVSDDYFPEEKRLGEVLDAVLPILKSESDGGAALVSWLGYEKKGSSDDRTLVVSWKEGAEAPVQIPSREAQDGDSDRDAR